MLLSKPCLACQKKAREFIASDDSGLSHRPHPESTRVGHHRIDFLTHVSLGKFIQGPGLKPLSTRFTQNALELFSRFDLSREWVEMPDLFTLVQKIIFEASVPAMFGKHLLGRNPSFFDDFCNFDVGVPNLAKRLPRWIIPSAYNARDKCLETIKRHHCFLKQECGDLMPDGNVLGYSDVYGAEIIRYRHDMWSKMEAMDSDAKAAEDLGMIWGANSNSSHVAFWLIYFINRDAQVLAKTREALHEACSAANAPGEISIDELCASPYLSALYAETLRLRSANIVMRKPERRNPV